MLLFLQAIFIPFAKLNARAFLCPKGVLMLKKEAILAIEETIGYEFNDKQLLSQAFTRSSYHYEHPEDQDNEVLEFIGDSVLSLIVVDGLVDRYTDKDGSGLYTTLDEGEFSSLRSFVVSKSFLSKKMGKLDLQKYLRMSIGDETQGVENGLSVMEDLFESLIGAIYLDTKRNLQKTKKVILPLLEFNSEFDELDGKIKISYKNLVQEWCDSYGCDKPRYITQQKSDGFISHCIIDDCNIDEIGEGHNGKEAEKHAAEIVYLRLEEIEASQKGAEVTYENAINMLQEYCQEIDIARPNYDTINDEVYEDNSHLFTVRCYLGNKHSDGQGSKVKEAKKHAAYKMLEKLGLVK